jgi:predicted hydrocarbon binding protein
LFSFNALLAFKRLGFRIGNWRKLKWLDKALYNCALELAKIKGKIKNMDLMVKLAKIIFKIKEEHKNVILSLA